MFLILFYMEDESEGYLSNRIVFIQVRFSYIFLTSYNLKYILLQRLGYTMLPRFAGECESEETIRRNDKVSFESCKLFSVQTVIVRPVVVWFCSLNQSI